MTFEPIQRTKSIAEWIEVAKEQMLVVFRKHPERKFYPETVINAASLGTGGSTYTIALYLLAEDGIIEMDNDCKVSLK